MNARNNISLTDKWLETIKVIKAISSRPYRLEVSKGTQLSNVVHANRFKQFRKWDESQDIDAEKTEIWEVEEIVISRRVKGVVQYQVWWTGCPRHEDLSEAYTYLYNCHEKLLESRLKFHRKQRDQKRSECGQTSRYQFTLRCYLLSAPIVAFSLGHFW